MSEHPNCEFWKAAGPLQAPVVACVSGVSASVITAHISARTISKDGVPNQQHLDPYLVPFASAHLRLRFSQPLSFPAQADLPIKKLPNGNGVSHDLQANYLIGV